MSTVIKAKRSSVQGKIPLAGDLELGEFAINTYDGKLYIKKNVNGTESIVNINADLVANDVLTLIKTVDGSGSGLDADSLDGLNSDAFAQLNSASANADDYLQITRNSSDPTILINQISSGDIARFYKGTGAANTSSTAQVTITNDANIITTGSIGIANSSPTDKLSVNGSAYFGANTTLAGPLIANSSPGIFGSVLFSTGNGVYWGTSAVTAAVGNTAPSSPSNGSLWFDTDDATLNVYYNDGTSSQWVTAVVNQAAPVYRQKTSNYTAINGDRIIADTSGGSFTITLPASPTIGNSVVIYDNASWGVNNLTIARNGSTIESISDDFVLDISSIKVEFIYNGSTWQVYSSIGQSGPAGPALTLADVSALAIALG